MAHVPEIIGIVVGLIVLYGIMSLRAGIAREFISNMKLRIEARYGDPQWTKRRRPLANIAAILFIALILALGFSAYIPVNLRLIVFAILFIPLGIVLFMLVYL